MIVLDKILVIGGAGYVGSMLVPQLMENYEVVVYDLFIYGDNLPDKVTKLIADVRNEDALKRAVNGVKSIIHLACISNDPSYELDPELGKSINYTSFPTLLKIANENCDRFIFASTSSVYGIKEGEVVETTISEPLTDYSKYKLECEKIMFNSGFNIVKTAVRSATVCGYSPRLRLDLVVNLLTISALETNNIKIFGGKQLRPNINIKDIINVYEMMLTADAQKINNEAFNAGYENNTVEELAFMVKDVIGGDIKLEYLPTNDNRSYHINSSKINKVLGFNPKYTIVEAIETLVESYRGGKISSGLNNPMFHNVKRMKEINLR